MAIPDFQTLMLPLLRFSQDGIEHTTAEMFDKIGDFFKLSDEERSELLSSGRQSKFENRVHWAKIYLIRACLLETTGRSKFRITQRGRNVFQDNPPAIDIKFLMQFPEFIEFRKRESKPDKNDPSDEHKENSRTPLEILEFSYQNIRQSLAQELLDTVKK